MSEYQYYDFYAIDKPLSRDEMKKIHTYSSRVNLSSRQAIFEYNYSDFRYNEVEVLNDFFDMMLYVSSWGNRRLLMKFPENMVSYDALKEFEIDLSYDYSQEISVFKKGDNVLIDMNDSLEEGEWVEGRGMLEGMLPLRGQILDGDYRVLYFGWLHLVSENPEMPPDMLLPSLPFFKNELDYSLESFMEFWEIDENLIKAADELSEKKIAISDEVLISQIESLSNEEKNQYLQELVINENRAKLELRKRLKELCAGPELSPQKRSRTLAELMQATARQQKEQAERASFEAKQAFLRKMESIEQEESKMWKEIEENAELKTASGYKEATAILKELKEYYNYNKNRTLFEHKLRYILEKYGKSVAFQRRMRENGVL